MKHWRRPLKRKGLTHTVRKMKEGDPDAFRKGKSFLEMEENIESDEYWNVYDPHEDYYDYWHFREPYDDEVEHFNLHHRLLEEIIQLPTSPFNALETIEKPQKSLDNIFLERLQPDFLILEKALYDHIKKFHLIKSDDLEERIFYLRESARGKKNIEKVMQFANNLQNMQVAKAIMFFSPFWIRSPQTWKGGDEISFIKHIFTEYDVPQFLYKEWFQKEYTDNLFNRHYRDRNYLRFEWLIWLIILGQGGSLKKASTFFQWRIPSGFQNYLNNLPFDLTPVEACIFAEVKRLGGNNIDATRLLRDGGYVVNPMEQSDENYFKYWQDTVRWLIRHRNEISDEEADIILDWAMHQYTESERAIREAEVYREDARQANEEQIIQNNQQPDRAELQLFSMKGRSVQRVLEHSNEYLRQKSLPWSEYTWKNHGWDHTFDDSANSGWEIIELTTGKDLYREGQDLNHCVSGYAGRCVANVSAIFSLRQNGKRVITIEIQPFTKRIIQARGQRNRSADKKENDIITQWVNEVLLK